MTVTRALVFGAIAAWAAAEWLRARGPDSFRAARLCWSAGALLLAAHTAAAMHAFYAWDHAAALESTARQTAAVTGLHWSGGLYVNYAFVVLWLVDAGLWWLAPLAYRQRSRAIENVLFAVFLFMVFNAAIVFGTGIGRAIGAIAIAAAVAPRARRARFSAA
ncbi:MAG TPA: hypothetical protein VH740_09545 [Vicinamibacterales bacterium]